MNAKLFCTVSLCVCLGLALAACGTTVKTEVKEVKVEVPVPCVPTDVTLPSMPFDTEAKASLSLFDKTKLLLAQDLNLKAYAKELEASLSFCKKQ
jgi:hypothetical protein